MTDDACVLPCSCIADLKDECAQNNGGCWQADHWVGSKKVHFSACQDNIQAVKVGVLILTVPPYL